MDSAVWNGSSALKFHFRRMKTSELWDLNNLKPVWTFHTSELCRNSRSHAVSHVLVILVRSSSRHGSYSHFFGKLFRFQSNPGRNGQPTSKAGCWDVHGFLFFCNLKMFFSGLMIFSGREKGIWFCSASQVVRFQQFQSEATCCSSQSGRLRCKL